MKSDFVKEQEKVRTYINSTNYNDAIELCFSTLESIYNNNIDDDYNKWFFNLRLGIAYRKLGRVKTALSYTNKSMQFMNEQKEYFESVWFMGNCLQSQGKQDKAVKMYKQCKDFYERNNLTDNYLYMSFNIARLTKDILAIYKVIEDYRKHQISEVSINNAYETLCEIYIENNDINNVEKDIINITDSNIVQKLRNRMQVVNTASIL